MLLVKLLINIILARRARLLLLRLLYWTQLPGWNRYHPYAISLRFRRNLSSVALKLAFFIDVYHIPQVNRLGHLRRD